MKAIIIDDEPKARQVLEILLEENCPEIELLTTAEDLLSGIELIKSHQPDVVFLDIEMPEHSGLKIMELMDGYPMDFQIIFTTAYSEYAIQAFELNAIDYLLKPLRPEKLKLAVQKAIDSHGNSQINERLTELRKSLKDSNFKKIGLPYSNGIKFVDFSDIITLKASGMYTEIQTENDGKVVVSKPLKHFVELLEKFHTFYRSHRSYVVNLSHLKEYVKKSGGFIIMDNGAEIPIANDKKEEFLTIVQNI